MNNKKFRNFISKQKKNWQKKKNKNWFGGDIYLLYIESAKNFKFKKIKLILNYKKHTKTKKKNNKINARNTKMQRNFIINSKWGVVQNRLQTLNEVECLTVSKPT